MIIKAQGKVSTVSVKKVRENRGEGAAGDQRVIVFKAAVHYTPELMEMLGSNIDEPLNIAISVGQRKLAEPAEDEDEEQPKRPRAKLRKGNQPSLGGN